MEIVVLTGAGISAESGINTFRGSDGLWENHAIEDVASPEGFRKDPKLVHRFYNDRRRQLLDPKIAPNKGHKDLHELAERPDIDLFLVTQNVDNLHERAGSLDVYHMHGELMKARCQSTGQAFSWDQDTGIDTPCPCCKAPGQLRPHIVWFGEEPFYMDLIISKIQSADVFCAIGTSGQVYPAAGFVGLARQSGARCFEINPEPTNTGMFDDVIEMPATTGVAKLLDSL